MSDNLVHALSGAGGGVISLFLTYPLNTVSQRLQVQKNEGKDGYKGTQDALIKIFENEGINGLYAGLDSALFGIAVTNAIYYYFYEWTKAGFERASNRRNVTTFETIVSGAVAGAATVLITNPIWVVNTRMSTRKQSIDEDEQFKQDKQISSYQAIKNIIEEDGVLALWQGVTPALILVSNPIIQYTVFEQSKNLLESFRKLGSLDFFFLGAFGKLVATFITYPYIVIKSRMQLRQSSSDENSRYESVWDGMRKIIKNEGVSGLYKGIQSKLLQSILNAAFLFMTKEAIFEYTVKLLHTLRPGSGSGRHGIKVNYRR